MDLWIRSQDKSLLIKCNCVGIDYNSIQVNFEDGVGFLIGEYSTKERALEILDEIQEYMTIDECNYENNAKTCYQDCKCYKSNVIMIYEMPKE